MEVREILKEKQQDTNKHQISNSILLLRERAFKCLQDVLFFSPKVKVLQKNIKKFEN